MVREMVVRKWRDIYLQGCCKLTASRVHPNVCLCCPKPLAISTAVITRTQSELLTLPSGAPTAGLHLPPNSHLALPVTHDAPTHCPPHLQRGQACCHLSSCVLISHGHTSPSPSLYLAKFAPSFRAHLQLLAVQRAFP